MGTPPEDHRQIVHLEDLPAGTILDPHVFDRALPADVPLTDRPRGQRIGTARVERFSAAPGGLLVTARLDPDHADALRITGLNPGTASLSFVVPDDGDGDLRGRMTRPA